MIQYQCDRCGKVRYIRSNESIPHRLCDDCVKKLEYFEPYFWWIMLGICTVIFVLVLILEYIEQNLLQ